MSYATANGVTLSSCAVTEPMAGPAVIDIMTPDDAKGAFPATPGGVLVALGGLSYACTVVRQAQYAGYIKARLVGGRGGWGRSVKPRGYTSSSGPLVFAQIAADAANEVGESVVVSGSPQVGPQFTRRAGRASQVFSLLSAPNEWWVDRQGITQVGAREAGKVGAPANVLDVDGESGRVSFISDFPEAFAPGKTFVDPTWGSFLINAVRWISNDATVRGEIWIA